MIDYEKLKLAHELAKLHDISLRTLLKTPQESDEEFYFSIIWKENGQKYVCLNGSTIEGLLAKLTELTQHKPKYKVGDKVWFVDLYAECNNNKIDEIEINKTYPYSVGDGWYNESELYPTKEALIDAQIGYWSNLAIQSVSASKTCPKCGMQCVADGMCLAIGCDYRETCKHEPCKLYRYSDYCANPPVFECKKCGEFYR